MSPVADPPVTDVRVQEVLDAIEAGQRLASTTGRKDLDQHLGQTREKLAARAVSVVVAGEFKRGKSTLVNALLQRDVCPVDADIVTAVPTTVRYADKPRVTTYEVGDDGQRVEEVEVPLDAITEVVSKKADPSHPERERAVEVGLPHGMLGSGLCLVDTPGMGGLDSAHGFLTLGALRHAEAVLFVTDAAQELTAPELAFLQTSVQRCPHAALVVTKTDLYPQWRRIVELDRTHLGQAGLSLPIIAVSSFLRLAATRNAALNDESGFAELVTYLARDVVARAGEHAARAAAGEVEFVAEQLQQQHQAEAAVIESPEDAEQVVAELHQAERQAEQLTSPTATWQQTLSDGIGDLIADVEHDLQSRLRTVLRDLEEIIDSGDPQETWTDTEVWLRRQVAMVSLANRDLLNDRADELTESVAAQFDLQAGAVVSVRFEGREGALDEVSLAPASTLAMPGGKLAPFMMAARSSFYLPMVVGSAIAGTLSAGVVWAVIGFSMTLGAGIGRKIIADERKRQVLYRQQQAKAAVRRYIDDVAFILNKQTRDGLRLTQRQLRDDFQARALLLQRSASAALSAAHRATELDGEELARRRRELAAQDHQLGQVRAAVRQLAGSAVGHG